MSRANRGSLGASEIVIDWPDDEGPPGDALAGVHLHADDLIAGRARGRHERRGSRWSVEAPRSRRRPRRSPPHRLARSSRAAPGSPGGSIAGPRSAAASASAPSGSRDPGCPCVSLIAADATRIAPGRERACRQSDSPEVAPLTVSCGLHGQDAGVRMSPRREGSHPEGGSDMSDQENREDRGGLRGPDRSATSRRTTPRASASARRASTRTTPRASASTS